MVKCQYFEEFGHMQIKCLKFIQDLQSLQKKKTKKLKNPHSINVVSVENNILFCEDKVDDEEKRCETLDF